MDYSNTPNKNQIIKQVDDLGWNHEGFRVRVTPANWDKHPRLKDSRGLTNHNAKLLLGDIIYWYRSDSEGRPRFKGHRFQKSYKKWAEETGLTYDQVKNAVKFLQERGLIIVEIKPCVVTSSGTALGNVAYFEPILDAVKANTDGLPPAPLHFSDGEGSGIGTDDLSAFNGEPSTPQEGLPSTSARVNITESINTESINTKKEKKKEKKKIEVGQNLDTFPSENLNQFSEPFENQESNFDELNITSEELDHHPSSMLTTKQGKGIALNPVDERTPNCSAAAPPRCLPKSVYGEIVRLCRPEPGEDSKIAGGIAKSLTEKKVRPEQVQLR